MTTNEGGLSARPVAAAFAGLLVALSLATAQPVRITQPLDASKSTVLIGNRTFEAHPENDQGPLDILQRIGGMTLVLKSSASQAADLDQFLRQQRAPSSPNFHQWLTAEQYADRFGVSPEDLEKVTAWLESEGFRVDYVARARTWILFSGTAGHVEKAFHAPIHRFNVQGKQHFANSVDPSIPAALDPVVSLTVYHSASVITALGAPPHEVLIKDPPQVHFQRRVGDPEDFTFELVEAFGFGDAVDAFEIGGQQPDLDNT
jgi:hypothetical protein